MMTRAIMLTVATMGLAVPALAQQSTALTDQQKQAVQAGIDKYVKAFDAKDAKGVAALYTEDGIIVGTFLPETLAGRAAIEKYIVDLIQQGRFPSDLASEADWKSAASLGNNLILVTGTWADTLPMPPTAQAATTQQSGSSQPPSQLALKPGDREHGSWTALEEMRGNEVLIRSLSYNIGVAGPPK